MFLWTQVGSKELIYFRINSVNNNPGWGAGEKDLNDWLLSGRQNTAVNQDQVKETDDRVTADKRITKFCESLQANYGALCILVQSLGYSKMADQNADKLLDGIDWWVVVIDQEIPQQYIHQETKPGTLI